MENKNNGVLIGLVVFLIILVLGLIGYIAYDKELIFNNDNNVEENNNGNEEDNEEFVEHSVPTDMSLVSTKLNEFGLSRFMMRVIPNWMDKGNLLSDSSNKLILLNAYFMVNNLTSSSCDDQCAVIALDTYKAKYAEVYGSLNNFELDTNNAATPDFSIGDGTWNISSDQVYWNKVWGTSLYGILEATSVVYDENNDNYVIDGSIKFSQGESKVNFKITYVNDGTEKYLTGITITSTEN